MSTTYSSLASLDHNFGKPRYALMAKFVLLRTTFLEFLSRETLHNILSEVDLHFYKLESLPSEHLSCLTVTDVTCLTRVSISCDELSRPTASGGGQVLFCLHFLLTVLQGRMLEAGAEVEVAEGAAYWLFSWLSQPASL